MRTLPPTPVALRCPDRRTELRRATFVRSFGKRLLHGRLCQMSILDHKSFPKTVPPKSFQKLRPTFDQDHKPFPKDGVCQILLFLLNDESRRNFLVLALVLKSRRCLSEFLCLFCRRQSPLLWLCDRYVARDCAYLPSWMGMPASPILSWSVTS